MPWLALRRRPWRAWSARRALAPLPTSATQEGGDNQCTFAAQAIWDHSVACPLRTGDVVVVDHRRGGGSGQGGGVAAGCCRRATGAFTEPEQASLAPLRQAGAFGAP